MCNGLNEMDPLSTLSLLISTSTSFLTFSVGPEEDGFTFESALDFSNKYFCVNTHLHLNILMNFYLHA